MCLGLRSQSSRWIWEGHRITRSTNLIGSAATRPPRRFSLEKRCFVEPVKLNGFEDEEGVSPSPIYFLFRVGLSKNSRQSLQQVLFAFSVFSLTTYGHINDLRHVTVYCHSRAVRATIWDTSLTCPKMSTKNLPASDSLKNSLLSHFFESTLLDSEYHDHARTRGSTITLDVKVGIHTLKTRCKPHSPPPTHTHLGGENISCDFLWKARLFASYATVGFFSLVCQYSSEKQVRISLAPVNPVVTGRIGTLTKTQTTRCL